MSADGLGRGHLRRWGGPWDCRRKSLTNPPVGGPVSSRPVSSRPASLFSRPVSSGLVSSASLFVFEASRLEACLLEASLSVSFRWVFGRPGHLRGVHQRFPPASSKPRRPGARVPPVRPEGDIVYVTLPSRAAIASVLDVVEAWGVLLYLSKGPAPQTSALFWSCRHPDLRFVLGGSRSPESWGGAAPVGCKVCPSGL